MNCPICPAKDLPEDSSKCPVCGADLTPIQRIRQLYLAQFNEAKRLLDLGSWDAAMRHVCAALALRADFAPALVLLGRVLWKKGLEREALARWEEAMRMTPDDAELKVLLERSAAEVKSRERRSRFMRVGGWGVGGLAVLGTILLFAAYVMPRLNALSAKVTVSRPADTLTGQSNGIPTLLARMEEIEKLNARLSSAQQDLLQQMGSNAVATTAVRERIQTLETGITASVLATHNRMEAAEKAQVRDAGRLETMEREILALRSEVETARREAGTLQSWAAELARKTVDDLRPSRMDELEVRMAMAEADFQRWQSVEAGTRHYKTLADLIRHSRAQRRLHEAEAEVGALKKEWSVEIGPWIRLKAGLAERLRVGGSLSGENPGGRTNGESQTKKTSP
jgi:hypothetical protein